MSSQHAEEEEENYYSEEEEEDYEDGAEDQRSQVQVSGQTHQHGQEDTYEESQDLEEEGDQSEELFDGDEESEGEDGPFLTVEEAIDKYSSYDEKDLHKLTDAELEQEAELIYYTHPEPINFTKDFLYYVLYLRARTPKDY